MKNLEYHMFTFYNDENDTILYLLEDIREWSKNIIFQDRVYIPNFVDSHKNRYTLFHIIIFNDKDVLLFKLTWG